VPQDGAAFDLPKLGIARAVRIRARFAIASRSIFRARGRATRAFTVES
jgi:hypothetical protein